MAFLQEFKEFVNRGNAVDLAVGVVIGAAFGKIVSSAVSDLIMPPLGLLIGKGDFSDLSLTLKAATEAKPAVIIKYGLFINTLIEFLIIAFVVFLIIKAFNKLKNEKAPGDKKCPECLMLIPMDAKRCGHCCFDLVS